MQFTTFALSALMGLATAQKVHVVSVASANNSLIFMPDNLKAAKGDMVQFQFRGGNHSVVQSTFDAPCMPMSMAGGAGNSTGAAAKAGIFSGFQPVAASKAMGMLPTYTVMVADDKPMWFYCSQGKHCQAGMVMVLNENTKANATRSLANYKALAKKATANVSPLLVLPRWRLRHWFRLWPWRQWQWQRQRHWFRHWFRRWIWHWLWHWLWLRSRLADLAPPTTAGASTAVVSTALSLLAMAAASFML
ncbi:Extracellular serine-rich protein [Apiospora arundinis]